jgi:hypothetical protein
VNEELVPVTRPSGLGAETARRRLERMGRDLADDYTTLRLLSAGLARVGLERRRVAAGEEAVPGAGLWPRAWRTAFTRLCWRALANGDPVPVSDLEVLAWCRLRWLDTVLAQPHKSWTPAELVDWAMTHGSPYFRPGTGYRYSDTNYILAGYIVEKVTGRPLARAYRTQILDPFGMGHTYLEHWEAPRGTLLRPFLGDIDTYGFNPTNDTFGGGGLVSTAADLTTFIRALFDGRLFRHEATLRAMLTTTAQSNDTYGLGIEKRTQPGGDIVWGHNGILGAFMMYSPTLRLSVAGTMNQAHPDEGHVGHRSALSLWAGPGVGGARVRGDGVGSSRWCSGIHDGDVGDGGRAAQRVRVVQPAGVEGGRRAARGGGHLVGRRAVPVGRVGCVPCSLSTPYVWSTARHRAYASSGWAASIDRWPPQGSSRTVWPPARGFRAAR